MRLSMWAMGLVHALVCGTPTTEGLTMTAAPCMGTERERRCDDTLCVLLLSTQFSAAQTRMVQSWNF